MRRLTRNQIRKLVLKEMELELAGRVKRWAVLDKIAYRGRMLAPALAFSYYVAAQYCWYRGDFLPTIILSQMALEEQLRDRFHNRSFLYPNPDLDLDRAGFAELTKMALRVGLITPEDGDSLEELRRKYRNPYMHPKRKNVKVKISDGRGGFEERDMREFLALHDKIQGSGYVQGDIEDESEIALRILCRMFPRLCISWHKSPQ